MTTAQLPKNVAGILEHITTLVKEEKKCRERRDGKGFTEEERNQWRWIDAAIETPAIAAEFRELDKDTSDYMHAKISQYSEIVNPDEQEEQEGPTLFDMISDVA